MRLFCFAPAGGSATLFYPWLRRVPREIDVCPVQLPGHGTRVGEPPCRRIEGVLEAFGSAVQSRLDLPFALFGHSMGAWIAYGAARRLRSPGHLFVSANLPPPVSPVAARQAPPSESELLARLRQLGGMPESLLRHEELMAAVLPVFAADLALLDSCHRGPDSQVSCPITACAGIDDPLFRPAELEAWSALTPLAFRRHVFPGGHFYLEPERDSLLRIIVRALA
ncbi:MAG: thioesterase [Alphaproteobacteria bacterium]|nr:thioesterase [Alphaproteobacteria bacterium]